MPAFDAHMLLQAASFHVGDPAWAFDFIALIFLYLIASILSPSFSLYLWVSLWWGLKVCVLLKLLC